MFTDDSLSPGAQSQFRIFLLPCLVSDLLKAKKKKKKDTTVSQPGYVGHSVTIKTNNINLPTSAAAPQAQTVNSAVVETSPVWPMQSLKALQFTAGNAAWIPPCLPAPGRRKGRGAQSATGSEDSREAG